VAKKKTENKNMSNSELKEKDHNLAAILSYIGILVLIPLLAIEIKRRDDFIRFHLKQGIVLAVLEIGICVTSSILSVIPIISNIINALSGVVMIAILIVAIIAIVKALEKKEWKIPIISDYTYLVKLK
jgi:uncharacterized membrane protein